MKDQEIFKQKRHGFHGFSRIHWQKNLCNPGNPWRFDCSYGQELGGRPYGFIGFAFDMTLHLKFGGEDNVLAVRLAPEDRSSRWYPGAGIYRNVWLTSAKAEIAAGSRWTKCQ